MAFTPTYYPVPNANDTTDLLTISYFINSTGVTDGLFFPIMILVIWTLQFIGVLSEGRGGSRAWLYASFMA
ncbi:MAG: hypothetical protein ACTSQ4_02450, partial [Candidatus Heimdallarchaeaceae archaeon]